MAGLTYVSFGLVKGLIRGLSANSPTTFSQLEELYPPHVRTGKIS